MSETEVKYDAVVVGAGSAGSAAALNLARSGMRVALLEYRSFATAGARWVNGIPPWMFDFAAIPRPEQTEMIDNGLPLELLSRTDGKVFTIEDNPVWKVDMRLLVARLHGLCREAGAELFEHIDLGEVELDNGRPTAVHASQKKAQEPERKLLFKARLFVDATGLSGHLRRATPILDSQCPEVPNRHICMAAQEVCEIADPSGVRAYLDGLGLESGTILCWLAVDGGFSTINIIVYPDLKTVDLLAGTIAEKQNSSGPDWIRRIKAQHKWIGRGLFGGVGRIPIRRPYDRLAAPGIALVGDSACQVFPIHASGVGMGFLGGKILADTVSRYYDPGSLEATWSYQARFHREIGPTLGGNDVLRRAFQPLSDKESDNLVTGGFLTKSSMRYGIDQKGPVVKIGDAAKMLAAMIREPLLGFDLGRKVARIPAVMGLYKAYPRKPGMRKLKMWSKAVAKQFDEEPDIN